MDKTYKSLRLRQLDERLQPLKAAYRALIPERGWIRAIREGLGMSSAQLGRRLRVTQQAANALEERERAGSISLATLQRAANAMDCELVYALVPRQSTIAAIVEAQAHRVAEARLARVSHTMRLEAQSIGPEAEADRRRQLETEIAATMPRTLWDDVQ